MVRSGDKIDIPIGVNRNMRWEYREVLGLGAAVELAFLQEKVSVFESTRANTRLKAELALTLGSVCVALTMVTAENN